MKSLLILTSALVFHCTGEPLQDITADLRPPVDGTYTTGYGTSSAHYQGSASDNGDRDWTSGLSLNQVAYQQPVENKGATIDLLQGYSVDYSTAGKLGGLSSAATPQEDYHSSIATQQLQQQHQYLPPAIHQQAPPPRQQGLNNYLGLNAHFTNHQPVQEQSLSVSHNIQQVPIEVPQPYPVIVARPEQVPVAAPHHIDVQRPHVVHVALPVPVQHPRPVPVSKHIPEHAYLPTPEVHQAAPIEKPFVPSIQIPVDNSHGYYPAHHENHFGENHFASHNKNNYNDLHQDHHHHYRGYQGPSFTGSFHNNDFSSTQHSKHHHFPSKSILGGLKGGLASVLKHEQHTSYENHFHQSFPSASSWSNGHIDYKGHGLSGGENYEKYAQSAAGLGRDFYYEKSPFSDDSSYRKVPATISQQYDVNGGYKY